MDTLNIDLVEDIGGWGFRLPDLLDKTRSFNGSQINVPINSFGGSVLESLAIYNALRGHPSKVVTQIVGYAMSAGTVVASAGDVVKMPKNGYYMIHEPWSGVAGDSEDMKKQSTLLESMAKTIVDIYKKKTNLPKDEIRQMMKEETWLTAKEALKLGFVDELTDGVDVKASFDIEGFNNVPQEIKNVFKQNIPNESSKTVAAVAELEGEEDSKTKKQTIMGFFDNFINKNDQGKTIVNEEAKNEFISAIAPDIKNIIQSEMSPFQKGVEEAINQLAEDLKKLPSKEDLASNNFDSTDLESRLDAIKDQSSQNAAAISNLGATDFSSQTGNPSQKATAAEEAFYGSRKDVKVRIQEA